MPIGNQELSLYFLRDKKVGENAKIYWRDDPTFTRKTHKYRIWVGSYKKHLLNAKKEKNINKNRSDGSQLSVNGCILCYWSAAHPFIHSKNEKYKYEILLFFKIPFSYSIVYNVMLLWTVNELRFD